MTNVVCGVDVSADTLDARIGRDGAYQRFVSNAEGLAGLVAFCKAHAVSLVVMEATGGYERSAFAQLWAAELPTAIVNPRSVRRFAQAMGSLEKTDRIDCGIIAWYAQTKRIKPTAPASESQQRLQALVCRMRQLIELTVDQKNQRRLVTEPDALASFTAVLATATREIRSLEAKVAEAINNDPLWSALDAAWRDVKGVSDRTVARLMAQMPELGMVSNKAIAKLAGLAPIANDSGKFKGKRAIRGGREGARSILFVVAELVRRFNQDFADFHQRLKAAGKPPKVVRVALARKLLVKLNAKARDTRAKLANAT